MPQGHCVGLVEPLGHPAVDIQEPAAGAEDRIVIQMLKKNSPISVLMSVYNGERWLNESIRSVLTQTFFDFEFIIVNDGSTDKSLEIIKSFAICDVRIVIIDKPNTGLADSLNRGIAQARGDWIARIDADDVCEPSRLQKQFDLANTAPDVVLIGTGLIEIDESGRPGKTYFFSAEHENLILSLMRIRSFFAHSSAFYKTEVVRLAGSYRPRIKRGQDFDLWLRLSEKGKLACVSEPLIKCRKHADQISHEESGQRQVVDSRVALISYWLRRKGKIDPVGTASSDNEFNRFREWVTLKLTLNNIFSYYKFLENIRQEIRINQKTLSSRLRIVFLVSARPLFVFRYVRERLVGEHLAKRLANEWIEITKSRTL